MLKEPSIKRAVVFFDGQNLFHAAKGSFGYKSPNYDPLSLAKAVCASKGWHLEQTRFYTGVPDANNDAAWNDYWNKKLAIMGWQDVHIFRRSLRYRKKSVRLPREEKFGAMAGKKYAFVVGVEKGIDVRIAIDVIRLAHLNQYDIAIIFSQDQDLSEVAEEIRAIAKEQSRWIKIASAFPKSAEPLKHAPKGINKTD